MGQGDKAAPYGKQKSARTDRRQTKSIATRHESTWASTLVALKTEDLTSLRMGEWVFSRNTFHELSSGLLVPNGLDACMYRATLASL